MKAAAGVTGAGGSGLRTVTAAFFTGAAFAASNTLEFSCEIPIAEWAGSGTLNTAQNVFADFESLLNTCNYFFNRNEFLELASQLDLQTNWKSYESLYFAVMWLKSGRKIKVVPGLEFIHNTESPDGVYRMYANESGEQKTKILSLCY